MVALVSYSGLDCAVPHWDGAVGLTSLSKSTATGRQDFFFGEQEGNQLGCPRKLGSMVSIWLGGGFKYFVFSPLLTWGNDPI